MRKRILSLLLCVSVISSSFCIFVEAGEEIDGFRDFKWGTSSSEIKGSIVTSDMIEGEDYIYYDSADPAALIVVGSVSTFTADVIYLFQNDQLIGGSYLLQESHTNYNSYYDDYCKLLDLYTETYGEPLKSSEEWSNDLYKGQEENIGTALALGYVDIFTLWGDDEGNSIVLDISGDNYDISVSANYYSATYEYSSNTDGI